MSHHATDTRTFTVTCNHRHKAPLNLGDGDLLAPKNHTMPESVRFEIEIGIQRISNCSENEKTFTILISNEPDIIPKLVALK